MWFGMLNKIQAVIDHGQFIQGPEVFEFEKALAQYQGCEHVISCGNGTDALQVALMTVRLSDPDKDEVIIPAFAYASVAEVVKLLGLKIVFCDVNIETFCIEVAHIEAKVTDKTLAIIPVHLFGQCADMSTIIHIAKKYQLWVIEDAAQAMGATHYGLKAGTMGHIGCTSFFPTKNLSCFGDGGALFTNSKNLAVKMRMICNHGQEVKYYHELVGINSRLDTIQAAVLLEKLKTLDADNEKRRWDERTKGIYVGRGNVHTYHQYTIKKRIPGKRIYYPLPLHWQNAYRQDVSMPVAELLSETVCSL